MLSVICYDIHEYPIKERSEYFARITTLGIEVYGPDNRMKEFYANPSYQDIFNIDNGGFIYGICEENDQRLLKYVYSDINEERVL